MTLARDDRLGAAIRARRIQLGLSQVALGERISCSGQQIQKYEKGTNQVAFPLLVEIAAALGISALDLVAAALGEQKPKSTGYSDRETLEFLKAMGKLTPKEREGVRLLVRHMARAA